MKFKFDYFKKVILRNNRFSYKIIKGANKNQTPKTLGMIRLRNEELVLQDTLDSLSQHVDGVVVYDDASNDKSVRIALSHPVVLEVIVNKKWRKDRVWEETANRRLLYQRSSTYKPEWFFYSDADERFEGDIKKFLKSKEAKKVDGIRISLFDAYMTPSDKKPYTPGIPLYNFRKKFGIERRDILMIWRNNVGADYMLPDSREPTGISEEKVITRFYCQHYGKSLSIEQWEENCRYYYENFPAYSQKWKDRMGKAIHVKSDFDTELVSWEKVKRSSIKI